MVKNPPYAIVLAGGKGTRLWPISRRNKPKHMMRLPLKGGLTMLQRTYQRLRKALPADHIYISTTQENSQEIQDQLRAVPSRQFCIEYGRKGTGVGIALGVRTIGRIDPAAVVVSINCDAYIAHERQYLSAIAKAARVARRAERIVLIGIPPAYPDTGLGYILVDRTTRQGPRGVGALYAVERFIEKPPQHETIQLLKTKRAYWNPTLLVGTVTAFWSVYQQHCPAESRLLEAIIPTKGAMPSRGAQQRLFRRLPPMSVEYDLLEKEKNLLLLDGGEMGWADIGQWRTVMEILAKQTHSPVVSIGNHVDHHSNNSFVYNTTQSLVTTVKLSNVILIVTGDVILAVDKRYAQDVKPLVAQLEAGGWKKYT